LAGRKRKGIGEVLVWVLVVVKFYPTNHAHVAMNFLGKPKIATSS